MWISTVIDELSYDTGVVETSEYNAISQIWKAFYKSFSLWCDMIGKQKKYCWNYI